ncbi:MAG TPA: Ku protein [Stellaceae bacterium]|nr:Ku protein [Stellaceae bacterium]
MPRQTGWSGYLKLSLVSCPVRLTPATTRANRVSFHRLDRATHNRIEMWPHDAESGEAVPRDRLVRGFESAEGKLVVVEDEELAALRIESSRTIELERFFDREEIDPLYLDAPYRLSPDGAVGAETFAVIREAMLRRRKAALGRVVLGGRERLVAVEARPDGLLLTTLRAAAEVRDAAPYFEEIRDEPVDEDMVELATRIIERKSGHFDPSRLEDRYQTALRRLIAAKEAGDVVATQQREPAPVIDLMAALKRSLDVERRSPPRGGGRPSSSKGGSAKAPGGD